MGCKNTLEKNPKIGFPLKRKFILPPKLTLKIIFKLFLPFLNHVIALIPNNNKSKIKIITHTHSRRSFGHISMIF